MERNTRLKRNNYIKQKVKGKRHGFACSGSRELKNSGHKGKRTKGAKTYKVEAEETTGKNNTTTKKEKKR